MRRRKWWLAVSAALVVAVALATSKPARAAKLFAPSLFGMLRVTDGIYADPELSQAQCDALILARAQAHDTIVAFYGKAVADPVLIVCATGSCYRRFGGHGSAQAHTVSDRLLLAPRGHRATTIAHEWAHAELNLRVGYLAGVPSWFDEGLATLASGDPRYTEERYVRETHAGAVAPHLDQMRSLKDFLSVPYAYVTARHEVARWVARAGRHGVLELFAALRRGERFDDAYRRLEVAQ